jgi:hypothetical protein
MAAVKFVWTRLTLSGKLTFDAYIKDTYLHDDEWALHYLADRYDELTSADGSASLYHNPIRALTRRQGVSYTQVAELSRRSRDDLYRFITEEASYREWDDVLNRTRAEAGIPEMRDGELLIDVPLKPRVRDTGPETSSSETSGEKGVESRLFVLLRDPITRDVVAVSDVHAQSETVRHLAVQDQESRPIRFFLHKKRHDALSSYARRELASTISKAIADTRIAHNSSTPPRPINPDDSATRRFRLISGGDESGADGS